MEPFGCRVRPVLPRHASEGRVNQQHVAPVRPVHLQGEISNFPAEDLPKQTSKLLFYVTA